MSKRTAPNRPSLKAVLWLAVELMIYAAFVVAYYFLVLLLLRDWLKHIFDTHKAVYALIAVPLIVAQAVLLDFVTVILRKLDWTREK